MALIVGAEDGLQVGDRVGLGCLDREGAVGHRLGAGELLPGQVGAQHIRRDLHRAVLVDKGEVEVAVVIGGGGVPAVFDGVGDEVFRPVEAVVGLVREVDAADGVPVGDILDLIVADPLSHKVVAGGHLEDPALVLVADGIGPGGIVAVLLDEGGGDFHAFTGGVSPGGDQVPQAVADAVVRDVFRDLGGDTAV